MTDVPNFFRVYSRFMFDLNNEGAKHYRNVMTENQRALQLVEAENDGANTKWPELQEALAVLARSYEQLDGREVSGSSAHMPVIGEEGVLLNEIARKAGAVVYDTVFAGNKVHGLVPEDGRDYPTVNGFVLDFRRDQSSGLPDGMNEDITCIQRVYNPVSKEWEWEYNYTMLVDGSNYYKGSEIRRRLSSKISGLPSNYVPSFRIALRAVAAGS